ncbi:MAG: ATP-binding protein [Aliishimia sp.]
MSINALNEGLNALRLSGMKDELEHQLLHPSFDDQPFTDHLLMLVNAQVERRRENKIKNLTSRAKFKYLAAPQDIKYSSDRNMAKAEILELLKCDWIERGQHVLLTGPSGTGKTWISCALGMAAVRKEKSVKYQRVSQLLEDIQYARIDGSLRTLQRSLKATELLILDDFALHSFSKQERADFFEVIEARSSVSSLIIVGQRPMEDWYSFIKDPLIADAFMDRI